MRTPDFRDLLLLVAVLLALLSGYVAAHEMVHYPPTLSALELGVIVSMSALTMVSVAAAARLWRRDEIAADPAENWVNAD